MRPILNEGTRTVPSNFRIMITTQQITDLVNSYLRDSDYALQRVEIDSDCNILVEIDRLGTVDVDFCAGLNRFLVDHLPDDDYALEVGSVSLTDPFVSKIQYQKHLGHEVEVLADGKKWRGQLVSVDDDTFAIDTTVMVQVEGKKRKTKQTRTLTFRYDEVTYTRYDLKI